MRSLVAFVVAALAAASAAIGTSEPPPENAPQQFSHERHSRLFPTCNLCHAGALAADSALFPAPAFCAACHDGSLQPAVTWSQPSGPHPSNLRFAHAAHRVAAAPQRELACTDCHSARGAAWMTVQRAVVPRCLACHGITTTHYAAPDTACATCHVSLAKAVRLTEERIAAFPAPPSHGEPGFAGRGGHGLIASAPPAAPAPTPVAASCATCHARDFCVQCHVDAREQPAIQALEPDPRSLVVQASVRAPRSHGEAEFLSTHGDLRRRSPAECRTCHTQESCLECHIGTSEVAQGLASAGAGRAAGASVQRHRPPSHRGGFRDRHAAVAAASSATCAGCHVRADCLDCHLPSAASGSPGYHPADFLSRHPSAAYARETSCSDCHSFTAFCADCHRSAGLVAAGPIGRGYHDAKRFFIAGHGQAARQSLESCVACHTERDCLTCHSALGGRRFSPHGPGFDPERLRKKNIEVCTACHGVAVPGQN